MQLVWNRGKFFNWLTYRLIINDASERSVSNVQRYCKTMTKNQDQKQLIYLAVLEDQKQFPGTSKNFLMGEPL